MSGVPIGSSLRAARERRQLSLADVEDALHIREPYLVALEQEHVELLPGAAYARAFLRVYAEFLDLDSGLLLSEWEARFGPVEQPAFGPHQPLPTGWHSPVRPLVALGVATLLLTAGGVLFLGLSAQPTTSTTTASTHAARPVPVRRTAPAPRRVPPPAAAPLRAVPLLGVAAWDPYGDRVEHNWQAVAATDGDPATYWGTETYTVGLQKPGVGLLLDASRPVSVRRVVLTTDTPGFTALVQAGDSPAGPFRPVSAPATVSAQSTFPLHGARARFYVVWITKLDHVAHVDEVRALG